ncbi:farnesol dehydrogenase-like [Zootermopsis nevadensis]|uniref:Dehydrogenase/reductase SDR family member 11 n=1 Tax=Zootermopsis nevadensis TaxID=136037 RepID=A0A067QZI6_ZOONE|nr:farnesol dehydrogenase-like [Zootermopsis nevadensis]KDR15974.1 Dehydrogenase/reductase SDR family member 11 [Zootermopsis nevadensis]
MHRWNGRVAMVTGASAGIGAAVAKDLVRHGLKVVAIARRVERVKALKSDLGDLSGSLYPLKADVSKEDEVLAAFAWVKDNLGGVDILINNAGITGNSTLHEGPVSKWRSVLDLNVLGLSLCTKEALQSMQERGVDDGHIVHISSINGHGVPEHSLQYGLMMYSATKNAVQVLTEGLRRELAQRNSKIKVTSISPGMVKTEILIASGYDLIPPGMTIDQAYDTIPHLKCEDICDAITYALGTPPHVQIHDLIIKPVGEPM